MATLFNTKIKDTYQSLLKLEDNTILTTTTKNVTDGLGNASPLYMSTTRVGVGTNAPTKNLEVSGTARINDEFSITNAGSNARYFQVRRASGWLCFGNTAGSESIAMNGSNLLIGTTPDTQTSSRLQITGSGSTSATTSFLVQNSSGQQTLAVTDDGKLYVGFSGAGSIGGIYVPFDFPGYGVRNFLFNSSGNAMMKTISNDEMGFNLNCYFDRAVGIAGNFLTGLNMTTHVNAANSTASLIRNSGTNWSTQSNGTCIGINLQPVIDTDASSFSAKYIGFYWNPNIADLQSAKHNAIETVTGNVLFNTTSGNTLIGTTTDSGYKLDVNGSTRVKGNSLTISASGVSTPPANYVALNFDEAPNHHQQWFSINSVKDLNGYVAGLGSSYDRIIFPIKGGGHSTWQFDAYGTSSEVLISARNSNPGNSLSLGNSSINFCGPWTVATIDRTNRKLVFGNMSTDVHHIAAYDILIKGAKPFEGNANVPNGGNVYVVGGTPSTSPAGNYGNVLLAHDGTSARGNVGVGEASPTARLQVKGSGSTSATTSLLVQNSAGSTAFQVKDNLTASIGDGFVGDGIRFEAGNNSSIVFRQGGDRIAMTRLNSDKLSITAAATTTVIGNGISTNGSSHTWLMEGEVTAAVAMDSTKYVKVFINGVAYKLAVCI